jgi:hypothetical protein
MWYLTVKKWPKSGTYAREFNNLAWSDPGDPAETGDRAVEYRIPAHHVWFRRRVVLKEAAVRTPSGIVTGEVRIAARGACTRSAVGIGEPDSFVRELVYGRCLDIPTVAADVAEWGVVGDETENVRPGHVDRSPGWCWCTLRTDIGCTENAICPRGAGGTDCAPGALRIGRFRLVCFIPYR